MKYANGSSTSTCALACSEVLVASKVVFCQGFFQLQPTQGSQVTVGAEVLGRSTADLSC